MVAHAVAGRRERERLRGSRLDPHRAGVLAAVVVDGRPALDRVLQQEEAADEQEDDEGGEADEEPAPQGAVAPAASATSCAASVGVVPTRIPTASSASFFAAAVPEEPEMIAPACPIVLPGGAEKPAM